MQSWELPSLLLTASSSDSGFRVRVAGRIAWHVSWLYGGLCMAVFLVRTMKRIIFHEARQYSAACALSPRFACRHAAQ